MNKFWSFFFVLIFSAVAGISQSSEKKAAIKLYNEALIYHTNNKYPEAIQLLSKAISIDPEFIEAYLVLAEAYDENKQPDKAIEVYRVSLPKNPMRHPYGYIKKAKLEYKLARYEDAKESYESFLALNINDADYKNRARKGIIRCEFAINAVNNPVDFKPYDLGAGINTANDEYWPCITADESTLVITRQVKDSSSYMGKQEDFYFSTRGAENWNVAVNAGKPLNTNGNEGAQTISADGRTMVFTACNRSEGAGRCDLYISVKEGESWSIPKNMGAGINTKYTETQPSLSADGKMLFFASDRPGGKGMVDLYVTSMNDNGAWKAPVNMDLPINTPGQEMSPFIHPDGQTFYFSSDEHVGLGGYDIFISRKDSAGKWSIPENIGYPINTNADEIGLIVNAKGNTAYYSSSKNPEMGKDIFSFELYKEARPIEVSYMKGKVFDKETLVPLTAEFELIDLETENMIFNARSDSVTGEFVVCIPANKDYLLNASRTDYLFYSDNFLLKGNFSETEPYLKDVPLVPIKIGETIVLKNIFFDFNSYILKNESKIELNRLVQFMKQYSSVKIEVRGHTDNVGAEEYNLSLSENRARSVKEFLVNNEIAHDRITYKGYGFSKPVMGNETEEGRAQNRRTEITITGK